MLFKISGDEQLCYRFFFCSPFFHISHSKNVIFPKFILCNKKKQQKPLTACIVCASSFSLFFFVVIFYIVWFLISLIWTDRFSNQKEYLCVSAKNTVWLHPKNERKPNAETEIFKREKEKIKSTKYWCIVRHAIQTINYYNNSFAVFFSPSDFSIHM